MLGTHATVPFLQRCREAGFVIELESGDIHFKLLVYRNDFMHGFNDALKNGGQLFEQVTPAMIQVYFDLMDNEMVIIADDRIDVKRAIQTTLDNGLESGVVAGFNHVPIMTGNTISNRVIYRVRLHPDTNLHPNINEGDLS